jgi:CheY-like chemotaxis protein
MEKARILIIDDEEDICKFSKSILEKTGKFEVLFSTTAIAGISLAKSQKPNLILLDILMPDMDGSDVAQYLSNDPSTGTIPVVFLTALAQKKDIDQKSGKIGGRFFFAKPVNPQELISRIQSILKMDA